MRVLFLGTPDFAVPSLEAILRSEHEVIGAITQPDRMRNRNKVTFSPVKECALAHGLAVWQYEKLSREGMALLRELAPDVMVTCAFGQILSREILALPKYGVINVHASLLPKYRGSSPIQHAILNGEKVTGVTIMRTAYEVDSGDILLQKRVEIGERERAVGLFDRLAVLGAEAIAEALGLIERGEAVYTPQNEEEATYFPMLKKEDGLIDFSKTAEEIDRHVRGMDPWPCAYTYADGAMLKVWDVRPAEGAGECGEALAADPKKGLIVACGGGAVELTEIQAQGGKRMRAADYLRGHSLKCARLGMSDDKR